MSYFLLFSAHFDRDKGIDYGRLSVNHLSHGCIDIWLALSSTVNQQYKEGFHQRGGMIPPCYRTLNAKKYLVDLNPIDMRKVRGVQGNFYRILPMHIETDCKGKRSDFGIHLDANVPGSLGCIVMDKKRFDDFETTVKKLATKNRKYLPLFVQYS